MDISKEQLEEFKEIYHREYGKQLSDDEAYQAGMNLVNLLNILIEVDRDNKIKPHDPKNS